MSEQRRKLIEVALPLEAINRESARDSATLSGHPWNIHYWWARRKLPACRAVLFAQLVDDPSSRPEEFPTQEAQDAERKRLFDLIERLVVWENAGDEKLLAQAHAEILKSTDGNPPPILDPFAGGGSIPLEAQRLGLEAHASDLNPVAVLINKALIEIPPRYAGQPPVSPGAAGGTTSHWPRATGLAEDVRRYSRWMRDEAEERIGHLYPKATLPDGSKANVIAWIWARTVTCPNPACGIAMPLVRSFWLSKKKDRPTWAVPVVECGRVRFDITTGKGGPSLDGTVGRTGATCVGCGTGVSLARIREESRNTGLGSILMAVVAEGVRQRVYLPANEEHAATASVPVPDSVPEGELFDWPGRINVYRYGMTQFWQLFTPRQLVALTTFSDLVGETRDRVTADGKEAGLTPENAESYANAVALYLAFCVDRAADNWSSIASWHSGNGQLRNVFARQAIPMVWDYAEANPFAATSVSWEQLADRYPPAIGRLGVGVVGKASQLSAVDADVVGRAVITDPPYYDNVGYADLSDFFYVWLRRSLREIYPSTTGTMLTPKSEELVATAYRFDGSKEKAQEHFERGFVRTFTHIRENQADGIPLTVFYAFKQAESDDAGTASTGWEKMLNGLIEAGLMVTATWPVRTERATRALAMSSNALASSIVLACRPRAQSAQSTNRRGFIASLKAELPDALRNLQQGSVAPVDLAQAAIGPGMAVFTAYSRVVEADGSDMTVRTALALTNQVLDETLSEQEGDFDTDTRFCLKWFSQYAWDEAESGTADVLARATNTSVTGLQRGGVFRAVAGKARLLGPEELPDMWDPLADDRTSVWEVVLHLARTVSDRGIEAAAALMDVAGQRVDLDTAKELAYLLYSICERRGWTQSAILFNALGTSWLDLESAARLHTGIGSGNQGALTFDGD